MRASLAAPASPLPLIGGRAADLLFVSDCFVTPGLAAALGARVAEALEQRTTVLVVDPHRPTRAEIAARTGSDGRPVLEEVQLPVYVPTQSAEERKEELALRNQFKGRTPEEIVAAQRTAPQLFPRGRGSAQPDSPGTERRSYQVLHDQIADEIAERQRFIDSMRALGKAGQHELRIKNEIADRMSDLARVERLQRAADEQAGASPPRPVGGPAVVTHGA